MKRLVCCLACIFLLASCGEETVPLSVYNDLKAENERLRTENDSMSLQISEYLSHDYENKNQELAKENEELKQKISDMESSSNVEEESPQPVEITDEERFAAKYLAAFAKKFYNPRTITVNHVWIHKSGEEMYYISFDLSYQNEYGGSEYNVLGNKWSLKSLTVEEINGIKNDALSSGYFCTDGTKAKKYGYSISAENVEKLFKMYI